MEMENVFKRTDSTSSGSIISVRAYNLVIGLVLCWGFLINWLMVKHIPYSSLAGINPWVFFIGYLASCFFGVYLFTKSKEPFISFIGYNFVVVPFCIIVNIAVHQYDPSVVLDAIRVTGLVVAIMIILGSMFPLFFMRIAGALSLALIAVIVINLGDVVDYVN